MSAVLDFRRADEPIRQKPSSIEAEQALLGSLLYENEAFHLLEGLAPEHFYEPFHGRLYASVARKVAKGKLAEPILLDDEFKHDPAYLDLGGLRYLAELVDRAPPAANAPDYCAAIIDFFQRRELIRLSEEVSKAAHEGSAAEAIDHAERSLMAVTATHSPVQLVSASEAADAVLAYLDAPEEATGGILTGIPPLDEHLGRLLPGDCILIPGRPGMGKSALAACIALNVARQQDADGTRIGAIEINSEMTVEQMTRRHLTDLAFDLHGRAAPTYKDIRRRRVTPEQRAMLGEAAAIFRALPLYMVKKTGLTLSAMRSLVRRQASTWARQGVRLGLVTVDHVGLMQPDHAGKDRYTDQTNIAIGMKQLADELGIPVIALVQLSRKVEDRENKRPQLADMRDSGAWEENADVVIAAYREAYYANKEPEPKDTGKPADILKWNDWDLRRKSKTIEAILLKVREGEESIVPLWASIGHNAIRGQDPQGDLL